MRSGTHFSVPPGRRATLGNYLRCAVPLGGSRQNKNGYGASMGEPLCFTHNPTLRLINRRCFKKYRNVLCHNTEKHKNKIRRELFRRSKNLSAGTLASLVKLNLSVCLLYMRRNQTSCRTVITFLLFQTTPDNHILFGCDFDNINRILT